jgi:hypothetical protein
MPPAIFYEITHKCVPGPNKDRNKAAKMRSFPIPERFIEEHSKDKINRVCNIFLALISDTNVWVLIDFARLVRLHIVSRDRPWIAEEFVPASPVSGVSTI